MTVVNDGVALLVANIRYFFFTVVVSLVVQPVVCQLTLNKKVRRVTGKDTSAAAKPMQDKPFDRHYLHCHPTIYAIPIHMNKIHSTNAATTPQISRNDTALLMMSRQSYQQ